METMMGKNIRPFTLQWYICLLDEISVEQDAISENIDYLREHYPYSNVSRDIYNHYKGMEHLDYLENEIKKRMVKYYERPI